MCTGVPVLQYPSYIMYFNNPVPVQVNGFTFYSADFLWTPEVEGNFPSNLKSNLNHPQLILTNPGNIQPQFPLWTCKEGPADSDSAAAKADYDGVFQRGPEGTRQGTRTIYLSDQSTFRPLRPC